jgi:hypothetical protein
VGGRGGEVRVELKGGARYVGEAVGGVAEGRGTLHMSNGDRYEGEFVRVSSSSYDMHVSSSSYDMHVMVTGMRESSCACC